VISGRRAGYPRRSRCSNTPNDSERLLGPYYPDALSRRNQAVRTVLQGRTGRTGTSWYRRSCSRCNCCTRSTLGELVPPRPPDGGVVRRSPHLARAPTGVRPPGVVPDADTRALLDYPRQIFDVMGLPRVGLTDNDVSGVMREFQNGADPTGLRRRWNQPD